MEVRNMKEQYCLPDFLKEKEIQEYDEKKLKEIKEKNLEWLKKLFNKNHSFNL